MLTHQDTLARLLIPAVDALLPAEAMEARQRTAYALTREGKVNPHALLLSGALVVAGTLDPSTYSTASTTTYTTGATLHIDLPEGTWTVMAFATTRAGNTLSANVDFRLTINGVENTGVTVVGSSSNLSACHDLMTQTNVAGNATVAVNVGVKSDLEGTSSIRGTALIVLAWRQ